MATLLDAHMIEDALTNLPEWTGGPEHLTRTVKLTDDQHAEVERRIMVSADAMNHHPDIERTDDETRFVVTTHSEGGVTELDIALASEINTVVRQALGQPPLAVPDEVLSAHAVTSARAEGQAGPGAAAEDRPAEEFMGVPAGAQGTPQVPLPDAAPNAPEPGKPVEQDPDARQR